jgi:hypothetical protein
VELLRQVFDDDNLFYLHQFLNVGNRQAAVDSTADHSWLMGFGTVSGSRLVDLSCVDLLLQIVCLEIVDIIPVPLGAFFIVPLPFAFCPAAGLLALFKSHIWQKPTAAYATRYFSSSCPAHRFLLWMKKTILCHLPLESKA